MRATTEKKQAARPGRGQRVLAVLVSLCLLLTHLNAGLLAAYAAEDGPVTISVGAAVTAVLREGQLTLSGAGDTDDFDAETAPFAAYADEVRTLVIEEGVTALGDHLFYGLGELGGELTLPASIVRLGDGVFSGASAQAAPHFTVIHNLFTMAAIVPPPQENAPAPETPVSPEPESAAGESAGESMPASGAQQADSSSMPQSIVPEAALPEETPSVDTAGSVPPSEPAEVMPSVTDPAPETQQEPSAPDDEQTVAGETPLATPLAAPEEMEEPQPLTAADILPDTQSAPAEAVAPLPEPAAEPLPLDDGGAVPQDGAAASGGPVQPETVTVYQQQIAHPETLFWGGQTGLAFCTAQNETFRQAAQAAGYEVAEGTVQLELDGLLTLELPLVSGQVTLPEFPAQLTAPQADNIFFTQAFDGWTQSPADPAAPTVAAGASLTAGAGDRLALYSVWHSEAAYQLRIKTTLLEGTAEYALVDGSTGEPLTPPTGYSFSYQWQSAPQGGEEDAVWVDLAGENAAVYRRTVDAADRALQFRCGVTAVKLMRSTEEKATLYSDPVTGVTTERTVYVDQAAGDDTMGDGTEGKPYKSIEKAALDLDADGTVETNKILINGTYQVASQGSSEKIAMGQLCKAPVTIAGKTGSSADTFVGPQKNDSIPASLSLANDLCFENIMVSQIDHIYGNGYDITIAAGVKNSSDFYLYGSGQNNIAGAEAVGVGKIAVYSGKFARLVGYVRSTPNALDVSGQKSVITVGGSAYVTTIIAGCASGAIHNADVSIEIEGGTVITLAGGNQGYEKSSAPYTGKTSILISGGNVTNVFGAGTGRGSSVPTYCGEMEITVTGGKVSNIYGAGSAAYVVSKDTTRSTVGISVAGNAVVGNIFAAGTGGDSAVTGIEAGTSPDDYGSLTGDATITVGGQAVVTGDIYASGQGYQFTTGGFDTKKNAYLNGTVQITVQENATVRGNIYGGGQGFAKDDYKDCARVTAGSAVAVQINGGTVEGSVYGGGKTAKIEGSTAVTLKAGTVKGSIYGGGEAGAVEGSTNVNIHGGTVESSVYGGALGAAGTTLVLGQITVNMTGGWVRGNLYGGSQKSNDGPEESDQDRAFVNLTGGTVEGNVFGGGFQGIIRGSTHLHIGKGAMDECAYYQAHSTEKPKLDTSDLVIGGSVYAGGDFGGDSVDYQAITVTGTSHVYIDGEGYDTGAGNGLSGMDIAGGVFGSGASCDAGSTRLVTLRSYGQPLKDTGGTVTGATRTLAAIQRADRVTLIKTHVQLTGQSDAANDNQTALYSLNRIGDNGDRDGKGNGVVLQDGSTLVLDSAVIETANFKSADAGGNAVALGSLAETPNTVRFNAGVVFRIAYTDNKTGTPVYGAVSGYAYMLAGDTAEAYAYARPKKDADAGDGGFQAPGSAEELANYDVGAYRYWQIKGAHATADRYTVLTAQTLKAGSSGYGSDYSVAAGSIELPPAAAGVSYTIESVVLPTGLTLVDAAKSNMADTWVTASGVNGAQTPVKVDQAAEQNKITASPLNTFGLFMKVGDGFPTAAASGKVISNQSAHAAGANTIIGQKTPDTQTAGIPQINFYLTYANDGISISKDLGTIKIVLARQDGAKTTVNVEIVTKGSSLVDQTLELYATQSGSYTGRLVIPAGDSRDLKVSNVSKPGGLVSSGAALAGNQFSLTLQPVKSQGWNSEGLMAAAYDLYGAGAGSVSLGTTDSRYEAAIELVLKNAPGFPAKDDPDEMTFQLSDGKDQAKITLKIHWQESIVSAVAVAPGRQYNGVSGQSAVISQKSAVTAAFTMGGEETAENLWLELRKKDSSEKLALPAGAKLTLLGSAGFYSYQAAGGETTVTLSQFTKMWESGMLSGNLLAGQAVTVILDLGAAEALSPGDYSLRLRNETGADSMGAAFTVNNSGMTISLAGSGGFARGAHSFDLTVSAGSDTRAAGGMTAVLMPPSGQSFPVGTVFTYQSNKYYPTGGKAYVPLTGSGTHTIVMDTAGTPGLAVGEASFTAQVFAMGQSAGAAQAATATAVCTVRQDPTYAIEAALAEGSPIVAAGTESKLTFTVQASAQNTGGKVQQVAVAVQKKGGGGQYEALDAWSAAGNTAFTEAAVTQQITVTVPASAAPGTYRLTFTLGSQTASCNLSLQ